MNEDILKGKWNQLKGQIKQQWAELTDDDLEGLSGQKDEIVGLIQERYGWERTRAESEYNDFMKSKI